MLLLWFVKRLPRLGALTSLTCSAPCTSIHHPRNLTQWGRAGGHGVPAALHQPAWRCLLPRSISVQPQQSGSMLGVSQFSGHKCVLWLGADRTRKAACVPSGSARLESWLWFFQLRTPARAEAMLQAGEGPCCSDGPRWSPWLLGLTEPRDQATVGIEG